MRSQMAALEAPLGENDHLSPALGQPVGRVVLLHLLACVCLLA